MTSTTISAPVALDDLNVVPITPAPKNALPLRTKRETLRQITLLSFDATNKHHRTAYAEFMINGKWPDGLRFIEEHPFTSAVTTAQFKIVQWALRKEMMAITQTNECLGKMSHNHKHVTT